MKPIKETPPEVESSLKLLEGGLLRLGEAITHLKKQTSSIRVSLRRNENDKNRDVPQCCELTKIIDANTNVLLEHITELEITIDEMRI